MPNDPKPPTDEIERCINIAQDEGYSGINARAELASLRADAERWRKFDELCVGSAREWLDSFGVIVADAEAYRFLIEQDSEAVRRIVLDIETGRRETNQLRKG